MTPYSEAVNAVSADWLSITCGESVGRFLISHTKQAEDGGKQKGFAKSECRAAMGGDVWRKYEPYTASKRWAKQYESWEWNGSHAGRAVHLLADQEVNATRIDIAFDLGLDITPDALADRTEKHWRQKGLKDGISGEGGINTRYIGGKASDRRIRIYRKDRQSTTWEVLHGVTLRVELVLKGKQAAAFWPLLASGDEELWQATAAAHISDMMGIQLHERSASKPEPAKEPAADAAEKLLHMLDQYGSMLDACFRAGIDVEGLASLRAGNVSRMSENRTERLKRSIAEAGPDAVNDMLAMLLIR